MITEDINNRLKITGLTNAKLADLISTSPAQVSLFLRDKSMLNITCLQKCFDVLGIDTGIYTRRFNLALNIAEKLKKEYTLAQVAEMSKDKMILITGEQQLVQLLDVNRDEFEKICKVGLIDFESTYPFFKSMVIQLMETGGKTTTATVTSSWSKIVKSLLPIMGSTASAGLLSASLGLFGISTILVSGVCTAQNALARRMSSCVKPLIDLTIKILESKTVTKK